MQEQNIQFDIITYAKKAHEAAKQKGWWDDVKPIEVYLMLIISELSECMEADRIGKRANVAYFVPRLEEVIKSAGENADQDHLNKIFTRLYKSHIKGSIEEELADAAIRIFDLLGRELTTYPDFTDDVIKHQWTLEFKGKNSTWRCLPLPIQLYYTTIGLKGRDCLLPTLKCIFDLAKDENINLIWHIDQKMKFNNLRSYKHGGKAY